MCLSQCFVPLISLPKSGRCRLSLRRLFVSDDQGGLNRGVRVERNRVDPSPDQPDSKSLTQEPVVAPPADIQDVRIGARLRSRLPPSCNTRSNTHCPSAPDSGKPRERICQSSRSKVLSRRRDREPPFLILLPIHYPGQRVVFSVAVGFVPQQPLDLFRVAPREGAMETDVPAGRAFAHVLGGGAYDKGDNILFLCQRSGHLKKPSTASLKGH